MVSQHHLLIQLHEMRNPDLKDRHHVLLPHQRPPLINFNGHFMKPYFLTFTEWKKYFWKTFQEKTEVLNGLRRRNHS